MYTKQFKDTTIEELLDNCFMKWDGCRDENCFLKKHGFCRGNIVTDELNKMMRNSPYFSGLITIDSEGNICEQPGEEIVYTDLERSIIKLLKPKYISRDHAEGLCSLWKSKPVYDAKLQKFIGDDYIASFGFDYD